MSLKILLICPCDRTNLFSSLGMAESREGRLHTVMPNIALPTLAALVAPDDDVTIVDEGLQDVDFDAEYDLVGITSYVNHRSRVFELAREFRDRGRYVVIGGPFASVSEEEVAEHCDTIVVGEAETTWPQFLSDYRAGRAGRVYRADRGSVDVSASPVPKIELLQPNGYQLGLVQTSRGCPFSCEFCDVPVYAGRVQRHKSPEQIVLELDRWYAEGYRTIYLGDDNFTVNRRKCREILQAMKEWNDARGSSVSFMTQVSIDIARDEEMLRACGEAGLIEVFVGIESDDIGALREVKKRQNLGRDLAADVRSFAQHGMSVQAGMILGFDADTLESPRYLYEFAQRANVVSFSLNLLMAPPGTPLLEKTIRQGRLREWDHSVDFDTNIEPIAYSVELQRQGARWLVNRLYDPQDYLARLTRLANDLPLDDRNVDSSPAMLLRQREHWTRLVDDFTALGDDFVRMLRRARRAFRGKRPEILIANAHNYAQAVGRMRRRGIWDPKLAERESPYTDADRATFAERAASAVTHSQADDVRLNVL